MTVDRHAGSLLVEVKISRVGADEILRQISLYREYQSNLFGYHKPQVRWFAALRWCPSSLDERILRESNIIPIVLGGAFDAFPATQSEISTNGSCARHVLNEKSY